MFHGEMHMGDGNILKQFQQILMHNFWEIDLHHLQPFLSFLSRFMHPLANIVFEEVHKDDGNMLIKF